MNQSFIKEASALVGKQYVESSPERLFSYSYDASFGLGKKRAIPGLAVSPANTAEVSALLRLAHQYRVPVVPRGAGSNLSGGTIPVEDAMVMVLTRLNRILEIDRKNLTIRVQPGVITGDLHRAVEAVGLFYPPDPASLSFCTIGGNLAECAGGPRGVKYGVTRDYVLGLEAVLADGTVVHTGTRTMKGVTGYDLTRLLVGSEGTLAIITEALLRLVPLPLDRRTVLAIYDDVGAAAETVSEIIARGVVPACVEFLDQVFIQCIEEYAHVGLPATARAVLLIEVDGHPEAVKDESRRVEEVCREFGVRELKTAEAGEERDRLWTARRAAFASIVRRRPNVLTEDIVVPRNHFAEMVLAAQSIAARHGLTIAVLGHAGDGNLHADFLTDENDAEELRRVEKAVAELLQETLRLGGTISGEHGVGRTKAPYLSLEIGEAALGVMKAVKAALDPQGILNPGKFI